MLNSRYRTNRFLAKRLLVLLAVAGLTFSTYSNSARRDIASGRAICDTTETACIDGSITWNKNHKMISINGKVKRKVQPGQLIFVFSGILGTGEQVFHDKSVTLRGNRGQYLSERFVAPYSSETIWSLYRISYHPADPTKRTR